MKRTPIVLLMLLLAACGPSTEPFGSPRHISVANWEGWCGLRTDIVRVFTRFFVDQTITKAEFINQSSSDGTAAYDWADLAQSDGANDIASQLRNVALAVGHTKVAVDERRDSTPGRNELASALAALPGCEQKNPPVPNAALQASRMGGTPEPIRDCPASDIAVEMSTEHSTYDQGQPVRIRALVNNTSSSACGLVTNPCVTNVFVDDPHGNRVWESNVAKSCTPSGKTIIQPGKPHDLIFDWNQNACTVNVCTNAQVPSGDYVTHARLSLAGASGSGLGSAQFTIRAFQQPAQPSSTPTQSVHHSHSPSPSSSPSPSGTPIL